MTGEGKNLRPIRYGPFRIVKKIGTYSFYLDILSYMHMYSIINVENLKLYEPPIIVDEVEYVQVPIVDDFAPKYLDELQGNVILDKRTKISCQGDVENF